MCIRDRAGEPRFILLMVYLILLNLGLIAIVYFKRWHFVGIISFVPVSYTHLDVYKRQV